MSSNYDSIPATTRNVIDKFIHNDNNKNANMYNDFTDFVYKYSIKKLPIL